MIAPAAALWDALQPVDRERVVRWVRQPHTGACPPPPAPAPGLSAEGQDPALLDGPATSARLVSAIQAEQRRGVLIRAWRDTGLLVSIALAGAAVVIYVQPPLTRSLAWGIAAWLVVVIVLAWHTAARARGRGVIGTPDGNVAYQADPEHFALGVMRSISLGAGLGIAAMLAALAATAF